MSESVWSFLVGMRVLESLVGSLPSPPKNELICSLLMKEEGEKAGLKLNIQNTNMASGPITPWQIDGETTETVADYFGGLQKSQQMVTAAMKLRHLLLGRKL